MLEEKTVLAENVTTYLRGMKRVVTRKSKVGNQILTENESYFLGIQYKRTSELREAGIFDNLTHAVNGVRA